MYRLDEGGGYLMGMSSHDIDFVCDMFGAPESVCADVRCTVPERQGADGEPFAVDADDTSVVIMRMQSGMAALVSCSAVALGASQRELELFGSDGRIVVDSGVQGGEIEVRAHACRRRLALHVPLNTRMPRSGAELPKRRARRSNPFARGHARRLAAGLLGGAGTWSADPACRPACATGDRRGAAQLRR